MPELSELGGGRTGGDGGWLLISVMNLFRNVSAVLEREQSTHSLDNVALAGDSLELFLPRRRAP